MSAMLEVNDRIHIPDAEFLWSFARSGGPGGQNVNKVASKALLRWDLAASPSVPEEVKARLRSQYPRGITLQGELLVTSQRFSDQERNRQDCLEKLRDLILAAARRPKVRKATRPSRRSKAVRVEGKRHRAAVKSRRRTPGEE